MKKKDKSLNICKKNLRDTIFCVYIVIQSIYTLVEKPIHHPKKMSTAKNKRKHAVGHASKVEGRESKDITCAVRLPRSMYQALGRCAKVENTSLSDIIRDALVAKMDEVLEKERERIIKEAEYEAKLRDLGVDPRKVG